VAALVSAVSGYDLAYVWKGLQGQGEHTSGGYYINAAQSGEPPGHWFGRGAQALGFATGQLVDRRPYEAVYQQIDPRDGSRLGRSPGGYAKFAENLARLRAAEPHATAERLLELEREAAAQTRKAAPYTDVTISWSKSISVFHASIRENARQSRLAGDEATAAWWDARHARFQEILQDANRAALEHAQAHAGITRTGYHGRRVDGQEPGKYETAGLVVTSWLQSTSRDGDPHDHTHNQFARMVRTDRDGKWRALDTMSLRAQLHAMEAVACTHAEAALSREFGVQWAARTDTQGKPGSEIKGISRDLIEKFSSRTQDIEAQTPEAIAKWAEKYGRAPNQRELLYIQEEVMLATRGVKKDEEIDFDELGEKWNQTSGGVLASVAPAVSSLNGPAPGQPGEPGPEPEPGGPPTRDARERAMQEALARVSARQSTWTRADLMRELAAAAPAQVRAMAPAAAVGLLHQMTDAALAGATEPVVCLEAPQWPPLPDYLRRASDGRSVYTRPGTTRYATHAQLSREEQLLADAQRECAPRLAREVSARLLGADAHDLEAQLRERAQDARAAATGSGLRLDQAGALQHVLTSPRTAEVLVGPAGSGKTRTLAEAARAWRADRRGNVIGLATSQAARNVLAGAGVEMAANTAVFLGHQRGQRGALGIMDVAPGSLIVIDETSMMSIADLGDIIAYAASRECKVIVAGDQEQLAAVEGGGGMMLLARRQGYVQLAEAVRFHAQWERDASLLLRAGDTAALDAYYEHGRIRGGDPEQITEEACRLYVAHYLTGTDVELIAFERERCREMSRRIRGDLRHLGLVSRGREVPIAAGAHASVGDLVICRENDHKTSTGEPGRTLANGDVMRIEAIDGNGEILLRRAVDRDPQTGQRQWADKPFAYRRYGSFDLAYAVSGHCAQGRTVQVGIPVVTGTESRQWLYSAMTRGAEANIVHVFNLGKVADPTTGTRTAPEIARHEHREAHRAGETGPHIPDLEPDAPEPPARTAMSVLAGILQRDGTEEAALEAQRHELSNADHLGRLHTIWEGESSAAVTARYERQLREHLPGEYRDAELSDRAPWLWRSLRTAEAAGLGADQVLADAIGSQPLTGTRDVAAVVDARVRQQTSGLVPLPPQPWAERVPETGDLARQEYLRQIAQGMDERTERLGEYTAENPPTWALQAFGPVPRDPLGRLEYERRAAPVAAYREMYGHDDPQEAIGPEPSANAPEQRAAWHAAFASLGPAEGVDVRGEPDGRLLLMRSTYQHETAWAPRFVGDELRLARLGADTSASDAVRADAEAAAAQQRGDGAAAERHEMHASSARVLGEWYHAHEAELAPQMGARREWEQATKQARRLAIAADSEYRRRHPDHDLEPLRSAEPEPPTEQERAQLIPGTEDYEQPGWIGQLAGDRAAFREKLAERQSVTVPAEDHEWEDLGHAWPDAPRMHRDAILQPPKPEIRPAEPVLQAGRKRELEAGS
jgi:conjugative relaxase-like TrwC/TraI family protein